MNAVQCALRAPVLQLGSAVTPNRLRDQVTDRAACRVQRLLHFQSHGSAVGTAAAPSEELVEQEVVRGVAEARERCKSDAILLKLQSQLPSVEVSSDRSNASLQH